MKEKFSRQKYAHPEQGWECECGKQKHHVRAAVRVCTPRTDFHVKIVSAAQRLLHPVSSAAPSRSCWAHRGRSAVDSGKGSPQSPAWPARQGCVLTWGRSRGLRQTGDRILCVEPGASPRTGAWQAPAKGIRAAPAEALWWAHRPHGTGRVTRPQGTGFSPPVLRAVAQASQALLPVSRDPQKEQRPLQHASSWRPGAVKLQAPGQTRGRERDTGHVSCRGKGATREGCWVRANPPLLPAGHWP